ncbi:VOC family protein [Kaarinaea lacus]
MKIQAWIKRVVILVFGFLVYQAGHTAPIATVIVPPINQPSTNQYFPGKFIWRNLFTNDVESAVNFYRGMFGWESRRFGGGRNAYMLMTNTGLSVAGIILLNNNDNTENQWVSFISVDDVNQTSNYVTGNGGKVLVSPRIFEQHGQLAIFADPEGAAFGVMNSSSGDPRDVMPEVGQFVWADLLAKQPKAQIAFYKGIADYAVEQNQSSAVDNDFFLRTRNVPRAGILEIPDKDILPNWLPYVRVNNMVDSIVKTTQLGGTVILEPSMEIYNGKLAVILDPTGAALGMIEISQQ